MDGNITTTLLGRYFLQIGKDELSYASRRGILSEYHRILSNSKDIGKHNTLLSAYLLGAWYIAMNRKAGLSPEENYRILEQGLQNSRLFRMTMGDADHYLDPKRIERQKKWAASTKERRYENDWVVEVLPGNSEYDLGYDYLECALCKLFRDENCPELTKYMCRLDYMFAETMGLHLERTSTLAEGGIKCDFRFSHKK